MTIQQSFSQSSPNQIYRSSLFSLSTSTYFACNSSYSRKYSWKLTLLDTLNAIDLKTNPSSSSSELVIQGNTLAYGLYEFKIQVDITMSDGSILSNSAATYIQIIPTGLAVFALQNGISNILVGSQQVFILDPATYSIDFDNLVLPSSLTYKFYCTTINLNTTLTTNKINIDLLTFQQNSSLLMDSNRTCFASNGIFLNILK